MKRIIPALFAILLFSCKDSSVNNQNQNSTGMFFEIENVNYAWGIFYQGIIIDPHGNEYSYNPGKDNVHFLYNSDGYYTDQELQSNNQHAKTYIKNIPCDILNLSHDLATKETTTEYSDTTRVGADMGSIIYSIYIYQAQANKYQKIVLRVEGDATFYNRSESAIALVVWLKQL